MWRTRKRFSSETLARMKAASVNSISLMRVLFSRGSDARRSPQNCADPDIYIFNILKSYASINLCYNVAGSYHDEDSTLRTGEEKRNGKGGEFR